MRKLALLLVILTTFTHIPIQEAQQPSDFSGPLLVSTTVGRNRITLYDVGSGQSWAWERTGSFRAGDWSPDGCRILIEEISQQGWSVLSIESLEFQTISLAARYPIWTFEDDVLTFSEYSQNTASSSFYNLDIFSSSLNLLFSVDGSARPDKWLSNSELLYVNDGFWFIWDKITQESIPFPPNNQLSSLYELLYVEALSPDRMMVAKFFDLRDYEYLSDPVSDVEDVITDWIQTVEPQPGFKLIYLDDETAVQVSMESFLQSLEWSPSGDQILVSTDPFTTSDDLNGIYIYNLSTEEFERVGSFPALYNGEYGPYFPTWSSDEEWTAIRTLEGHVIYNLIDGQTIELNEHFNSFNMRLSWSPIMDYTNAGCTSDA